MYGDPGWFRSLSAIDLDNVIYSVHFYYPHDYTHQGILTPISVEHRWPDEGRGWNRDFIRRGLEPVIAFQKEHKCRILVGEFSAIAWAEGAADYLRDCIAVFGELGWDWTYHAYREYQGWNVEMEAVSRGRGGENFRPSADNPRKRALLDGLRGNQGSDDARPAPSGAARPDYATLIYHRGGPWIAPENTLPAFRGAVERGFGFECDVWLSSDKRVFTIHDGNFKRVTEGACAKSCEEASWADEISKMDVGGWGRWKGSKFSPTRPALLEEVLELAADGRQIYVEVKSGPKIVPYVKDIYARQEKATAGNTLFLSFFRATCRELKRQMPEFKVLWCTTAEVKGADGKLTPITVDHVLEGLRETGADGVTCLFNPEVITADFIAAVKERGYEFHVWVVDDLDKALLAFERGAQTVTTNFAQQLLDKFRKREAELENGGDGAVE